MVKTLPFWSLSLSEYVSFYCRMRLHFDVFEENSIHIISDGFNRLFGTHFKSSQQIDDGYLSKTKLSKFLFQTTAMALATVHFIKYSAVLKSLNLLFRHKAIYWRLIIFTTFMVDYKCDLSKRAAISCRERAYYILWAPKSWSKIFCWD